MTEPTFSYSTVTDGEALVSSLADRVAEYNSMQGDRRSLITLKSAEGNRFVLRVREGATPGGNLDFVGECTEENGTTAISGRILHDPADGKHRLGDKLYGLFLRGFARLTVLVLFYGMLLGISWLMPGRNFWLPAVPPMIALVVMIARGILSAKRLPNRVDRFFTDFCGCTKNP